MSRTATDWGFRKEIERARAAHVTANGPGCQICGTVPKTRGLQWDHDHATGRTRGWLCHRCNRNLPTWVDRDWCLAAAAYLDPDGLGARLIEYVKVQDVVSLADYIAKTSAPGGERARQNGREVPTDKPAR